jgi:hypothetical protein
LHRVEENYYAFYCPGCKENKAVPVKPRENGWEWNGSLDSPSFHPSLLWNVAGSNPMVPICHSFVKDGKIQYLGDCTHGLAGQTVDIPEWEAENG